NGSKETCWNDRIPSWTSDSDNILVESTSNFFNHGREKTGITKNRAKALSIACPRVWKCRVGHTARSNNEHSKKRAKFYKQIDDKPQFAEPRLATISSMAVVPSAPRIGPHHTTPGDGAKRAPFWDDSETGWTNSLSLSRHDSSV